jgi:uncharacterized membrane protein (UPF0182 family)
MYVEPIYLRASSGSLPEVKRVIVYFNERIAYEETLAQALESMFGSGAAAEVTPPGTTEIDDPVEPPSEPAAPEPKPDVKPEPPKPPVVVDGDYEGLSKDELISLAQGAFDTAEQAMRNGDWAAYGAAQDELGKILAALAAQAE